MLTKKLAKPLSSVIISLSPPSKSSLLSKQPLLVRKSFIFQNSLLATIHLPVYKRIIVLSTISLIEKYLLRYLLFNFPVDVL